MGSVSVGTLKGVHQIDYLVGCHFAGGLRSHTDLCAAGFGEDAQGLTGAVAVDERILLGIGQSLTELLQNVVLQIECVIVRQC